MAQNIIENWGKVQDLLRYESDISKVSYIAFLKNLKPLRIEDDTIIIQAEDKIVIDIIEKKYLKTILIAISETMNESYDVRFVLEDSIVEDDSSRKHVEKNQFLL